jgi:hypothetical protein
LVAGILLSTMAVAGCGASSAASPTSGAGLQTARLSVGGHKLSVELAVTPAERQHGLSDRDALAEDAGMLFDMGQVGTPDFWMKDMRFPLDMVWIDARKHVAGVTADVQPQPGAPDSALKLYRSPAAIRYVLELNAGAAKKLGFTTGASVDFTLPAVTPVPG